MSSFEAEILATKIAAIREIYNFIDKKIPLFVDAEIRLQEGLEQQKEAENKYGGATFVIMSIAAAIAFVIPLSFISQLIETPLYYASPVFGIIAVYMFRNNYRKKKMPAILKATKEIIEDAEQNREGLMNVINQSYYNIKGEMFVLLHSTEDVEFVDQINDEGNPPECGNLIALDYMYHAITKGLAYPFSDAIKHFSEIKEKLKNKTDEKSVSLYNEILDGELKAEYRCGIIKRCEALQKENLLKKVEKSQEKEK